MGSTVDMTAAFNLPASPQHQGRAWKCSECGESFTAASFALRCPECRPAWLRSNRLPPGSRYARVPFPDGCPKEIVEVCAVSSTLAAARLLSPQPPLDLASPTAVERWAAGRCNALVLSAEAIGDDEARRWFSATSEELAAARTHVVGRTNRASFVDRVAGALGVRQVGRHDTERVSFWENRPRWRWLTRAARIRDRVVAARDAARRARAEQREREREGRRLARLVDSAKARCEQGQRAVERQRRRIADEARRRMAREARRADGAAHREARRAELRTLREEARRQRAALREALRTQRAQEKAARASEREREAILADYRRHRSRRTYASTAAVERWATEMDRGSVQLSAPSHEDAAIARADLARAFQALPDVEARAIEAFVRDEPYDQPTFDRALSRLEALTGESTTMPPAPPTPAPVAPCEHSESRVTADPDPWAPEGAMLRLCVACSAVFDAETETWSDPVRVAAEGDEALVPRQRPVLTQEMRVEVRKVQRRTPKEAHPHGPRPPKAVESAAPDESDQWRRPSSAHREARIAATPRNIKRKRGVNAPSRTATPGTAKHRRRTRKRG